MASVPALEPTAAARPERDLAASPATGEETAPAPARSQATDRFRGLAIAMMVAANFLAQARCVPAWLKHAPDVGLTVVDLVAPFFIFAIGLTFGPSARRRLAREGAQATTLHFVGRYLALVGLGALFSLGEMRFAPEPGRDQTWGVLQAVGVAGLLAFPAVFASVPARIAIGTALLAGYQAMLDREWLARVLATSHGGPEGSLAWTAMLVGATVLSDLRSSRRGSSMPAAAALVLAAGAALAFAVPLSKNRVSASYVLVALGASGLVFAAFDAPPSAWRARVPMLDAWGTNPLLLYVLHQVLLSVFVLPSSPGWYVEAPGWLVALQCAALMGVLAAAARALAKRRLVFSL